MWARVTRASRSPNARAISKRCCARRRYSSALLATRRDGYSGRDRRAPVRGCRMVASRRPPSRGAPEFAETTCEGLRNLVAVISDSALVGQDDLAIEQTAIMQ